MAEILSETPKITLSVPVCDVGDHMVTAVEQGYEWFTWDSIVFDKDDNIVQATLHFAKDGDEDQPAMMIFTDKDFIRGLQRYLDVHGENSTVRYQGDGDWDIDACGADSIVQMAVYDQLIFS